jgi:hypothetical protein
VSGPDARIPRIRHACPLRLSHNANGLRDTASMIIGQAKREWSPAWTIPRNPARDNAG